MAFLIRQTRVGQFGKDISIVKIRTMKDGKVTMCGRFLRQMCIDEWPQFANIAKGEMRLVGPRPLLRDTTNWGKFSEFHLLMREQCKPGLLSPIYYKPFNSGNEARQNELEFMLEQLQKPFITQVKYAIRIIFNLVTYRIKNESCRPAAFKQCGDGGKAASQQSLHPVSELEPSVPSGSGSI